MGFFADFIKFNPSDAVATVVAAEQLSALNEFQRASHKYYNLATDLIRQNYQQSSAEQTKAQWHQFTGPEGLDSVKDPLYALNNLHGGALDTVVHKEWRVAADKLFRINNKWHDTLDEDRAMSWDEYKESDEYAEATRMYREAEDNVAKLAAQLTKQGPANAQQAD